MFVYTYGICVCVCAHFPPRDHNKPTYLRIYACIYIWYVCAHFPPRDCSKLRMYTCVLCLHLCVRMQALSPNQHTVTTVQHHSQHCLRFSLIPLMLFLLFPSFLLPPSLIRTSHIFKTHLGCYPLQFSPWISQSEFKGSCLHVAVNALWAHCSSGFHG